MTRQSKLSLFLPLQSYIGVSTYPATMNVINKRFMTQKYRNGPVLNGRGAVASC